MTLPFHLPAQTHTDDANTFVGSLFDFGLHDCGYAHNFEKRLTARERLAALLRSDLGFEGYRTNYASHDLHAFAAKFPPQLARVFVQGLSSPGETVLDPMVGSGTTVVEAALCGRRAIGVDIDPLALRLARVKTTRFNLAQLRETVESVLAEARRKLADTAFLERKMEKRFDIEERDFIDYWFSKPSQLQLLALLHAMDKVTDDVQRSFLELTFSSVIVTKSGGVSRARDLAHSRPHRVEKTSVKDAIDQFSLRAQKNLSSLSVMRQCRFKPRIIQGDARSLTLTDESVDLIVTSPPYANAIDYMRAHKFSLVWLGDSLPMLTELRAQYIGSERMNGIVAKRLPEDVEVLLDQLRSLDSKKSSILRKYFDEMASVIGEMHRVLRAGRCLVMVVGSSTMRGMDVETHLCLVQIARLVGFDVVGISKRQLDRNRRMMPARFGARGGTGIENRMHDEYVIGLLKTSR